MFLHIVRHPIRILGAHFAHYFTQGKKDNVLMMALLDDMLSGGISTQLSKIFFGDVEFFCGHGWQHSEHDLR